MTGSPSHCSAPRAFLAVALLALVCGGCRSAEPAAWLSRVRALSEEADRALAAGRATEADQALARLLGEPPPAALLAEEARAVLQDAWARRALLHLNAGQAAAAEEAAGRGLALGDGADVYQATLLLLRGRAREALGRDEGAARDYDRAAALDEALLRALFAEPSDGGTR